MSSPTHRPGTDPDAATPSWRRRADRASWLWGGVGALLWLVALYWAKARLGAPLAIDFPPMYGAGDALLHGQPLYSVPRFVYPPLAALAYAPFTVASYDDAAFAYSVVQVIVPLVAAGLLGASLAPRHRLAASGLLAVLLLKAPVYIESLVLYNPSLLFVLPLVVIALLWGRGAWVPGAVILGVSIAVKPLLLLLVLAPLFRRDFRTAIAAALAAFIPTLIMLPFVHDMPGLVALPMQILNGTELHGEWQAANVSLVSVAVVHPSWQPAIWVVRVALGIAVGSLIWRSRTWSLTATSAIVLLGALALTLPVIGSINEMHYCLLALPPCAAMATGRLGRTAQVMGLLAAAVLICPIYYLGLSMDQLEPSQLRWALGSTLALAACCAASPISSVPEQNIATLGRPVAPPEL